jgi:Uri superfamily endonuclease
MPRVELPSLPGAYLLIMHSAQICNIQVGNLGLMEVKPGIYIYTGSAFGPGGLRGRISHHLKVAERPRWHIDYLRKTVEPVEVWFSPEKRLEHVWGSCLAIRSEVEIPIPRFGASDCRCLTHLFYLEARKDLGHLLKISGLYIDERIRIEP